MYRSGEFVSDFIEPIEEEQNELTDEQVQPNGVDLTVENIYRPSGLGKIQVDGKKVAEREEVQTIGGKYLLEAGAYVVQYGEKIAVPENHIGFVFPRSSLMRNFGMLHTAVWDAGYVGGGEGLLVLWNDLIIEEDARIGQFVLSRTEELENEYDGTYQNERV